MIAMHEQAAANVPHTIVDELVSDGNRPGHHFTISPHDRTYFLQENYSIGGLRNLPGRRSLRSVEVTGGGGEAIYAPLATPLAEQQPFPIWGLAFEAIPVSGFLYGASELAKGVKNKDPRRRVRGINAMSLSATLACLPGIARQVTPTETAPVAIETEQLVNGEFTFVGPNGAFPGSLTTADCTPLTGSPHDTYKVYYDLVKGSEVKEKAWQLCSATLNLHGSGVLPDVSSKVAVLVDRTANASYVLMGESEQGSENPYGRLAVLKEDKLDLTNAPRFEVLDQEDGSKKIYVTGTFADGTDGPYNLDVNVDVSEGITTESLPPYIMGAVLPLLEPLTSDYLTPTAPAPEPTAIPTSTPESTATPEASMTMDDWYKILYDDTFTGLVSGEQKPLELVFGPSQSEILTDPEKISKLPEGIPLAVFHPNGLITTPTNPNFASEQAKIKGTYVMTTIDRNDRTTNFYTSFAIIAASNAQQEGNENIRVEFGRDTANKPFRSVSQYIRVSDIYTNIKNGVLVSPAIVGMPTSIKVGHDPTSNDFYTLPQLELGEPNETNWLDVIIKAGYEWIMFDP